MDIDSRLWSRRYAPFALAAVALVTLGAFENRATTTILPTIARDLHGMSLVGAAMAAPLVSILVGSALAGVWTDRRGPVRVLLTGATGFVLVGLASWLVPSMASFVGVRLASGFCEGLLDVGLTVMAAQAVPSALRPRLFSMYAVAWIVPSLVGPSIAGWVASAFGWRTVFLMSSALMPPLLLLLLPAMRRVRESERTATESPSGRRTLVTAVLAATGLSMISLPGSLFAGSPRAQLLAVALVAAGTLVLGPTVARLMPSGVATVRPGAPSVVVLRGLFAGAFGVSGAFLPLMLSARFGFSPAAAGITLTLTGVFWAVGSNLNSIRRVRARWTDAERVRGAAAGMVGGLTVVALATMELLPLPALLLGWTIAGVTMGIASNSLATALIDLTPPAEQGRFQAAALMSGTVANTIPLGIAGAAIAVQPGLPATVFVGIIGSCAVLATVATLLAGRVDPRCGCRQSIWDASTYRAKVVV